MRIYDLLMSALAFNYENCTNKYGRGHVSQIAMNAIEKIGFLCALLCSTDDYQSRDVRRYLDKFDKTGYCSKYFVSGEDKGHDVLDLVAAYLVTIGKEALKTKKVPESFFTFLKENIHTIIKKYIGYTAHLAEWLEDEHSLPLHILYQKALYMFKCTNWEQKYDIFGTSDPFYSPHLEKTFTPVEWIFNFETVAVVHTDADGKDTYHIKFKMVNEGLVVMDPLMVRIMVEDDDIAAAIACKANVFITSGGCPKSCVAINIKYACQYYILADTWASINSLIFVKDRSVLRKYGGLVIGYKKKDITDFKLKPGRFFVKRKERLARRDYLISIRDSIYGCDGDGEGEVEREEREVEREEGEAERDSFFLD